MCSLQGHTSSLLVVEQSVSPKARVLVDIQREAGAMQILPGALSRR